MQTRVSSKGQIVLPGPIRRKLGLQLGDSLDATIDNGCILLVPRRAPGGNSSIIRDPITGLPVLTTGSSVPALTSEQVREILEDSSPPGSRGDLSGSVLRHENPFEPAAVDDWENQP